MSCECGPISCPCGRLSQQKALDLDTLLAWELTFGQASRERTPFWFGAHVTEALLRWDFGGPPAGEPLREA